MNIAIFLFSLVLLDSDALSICSKYTSKAGQALSVVTDPVCSATCRIRNCGAGRCRSVYKHYGDREDRFECVCDKCRNPLNVYGSRR
ncbi:hypothetical protein Q1695_001270 [Nippostrongylus brasiliensis]|nr:hypothetical protein Q1695_001270 [Nippostrongylus brasiliensis]